MFELGPESITLEVAKRQLEPGRVVHLVLQAADGRALPSACAGAHINLSLANGLIRPYSLMRPTPAGSTCYEIGVHIEEHSRGGSAAIEAGLPVGSLVKSSSPRNLFALQAAQYSLLVAGGIGITPILAMAEELEAAGANFELHYCVRSLEDAPFLKRIRGCRYAAKVHVHASSVPGSRMDVTKVVARCSPPLDTMVYTCGPTRLVSAVTEAALDAGISSDRIRSEQFTPPVEGLHQTSNSPFRVVLATTGASILVDENETAAHALVRAGVSIPLSCEQGVCGTCMVGLVSGVPEHRDFFLTERERQDGKLFLPCCSRARSAVLVIDM